MFEIIFDNGGGTTLQTDSGYRHHYGEASQAAEDVKILLAGGDTGNWDGNEADDWDAMEYDYDVERNGGYCWHYEGDIRRILANGILHYSEQFGGNTRVFYETLGVEVED